MILVRYEELQEYLDNHTLEEACKNFNMTKKAILELQKQGKVKIKYERRTQVTEGLIPIEEPMNKLVGKKRESYNSIRDIDSMKHEKEHLIEEIRQKNWHLGAVLNEINRNADIAKQLMNSIGYYSNLSKTLDKVINNELDYCSFLEEERCGKRPNYERLDKELLNDDIVLSYVYQKYGMNVGLGLQKIIEENKKENYLI